MTPGELFRQNKLNEAIAAAIAEVKKHPTDQSKRGLLAELFCFQGEWERADKQLEALLAQDAQLTVGVSLFRQLIRAEIARREFAVDGRLPEFLDGIHDFTQNYLKASVALREGNNDEATQLLLQAETERPHPAGKCNGQPFADFRDLDDLFSSTFEVLTSTGKYYWVPISHVISLEFRAPERPRDLLWRAARMVVQDGPDGEVYLPTTYIDSFQEVDETLRLGHATDWRSPAEGLFRGVGQRMFMVGEQELSILELESIKFAK